MDLSAIVEGFCYRTDRGLDAPRTAGWVSYTSRHNGSHPNTEQSLRWPVPGMRTAQHSQSQSRSDKCRIFTRTGGEVGRIQLQSSSSCHETTACAKGVTETMENCESALQVSSPYRTRIFHYLALLYGSDSSDSLGKAFSHLEEGQKVEVVKCLALSKISSNRHPACEICFHQFQKRSDLSRHLCSHFNVRPYACSICGKRFVQKGSANAHVKTHIRQKSQQAMRNALDRRR